MLIKPCLLPMVVAIMASSILFATDLDAFADTHEESDFVTTWRIESSGESIRIPVGGYAGTYLVDWGDGSTTAHSGDAVHEYVAPGEYQVRISGEFARIHLGEGGMANAAKLVSIDQWGDIPWSTMASAFDGAYKMKLNSTDDPDLSRVTDMSFMFNNARSFNTDISSWDVSNVADMSGMLAGTESFNQPLDSWDVSNVTDMSHMFARATSFNQPIGSWDVSNVTDMSHMFARATSFNQPIGSWDVSNVTDMSGMLAIAHKFNQPIGSWDVSNVTDMSFMLSVTIMFNQDLNSWDTSSVTDMQDMFSGAAFFNGDISSWDVSNVTDMSHMFSGAVFNGDISSWDVSNVTDMSGMFIFTERFNQPIGSWDVSNVTKMKDMFAFSESFEQDLGDWYVMLSDFEVGAGQTKVGTISPKNVYLAGQEIAYEISGGGGHFWVDKDVLRYRSPNYPDNTYHITITAKDLLGLPVTHSKDVTIRVTNGGIDRLALKSTVPIHGSTITGNLDEGRDGFGTSVASIGDLDGDGVSDIVAGAPGRLGESGAGRAFVMYLNPDGTVKRAAEINDTTPNGPSITEGSRFGSSTASIGDLDGDGAPDLAVGAPLQPSGGSYAGTAYLMMMNPDGTIKRTVEINAQMPNGPSLPASYRFGTSVAGIGDLDGDGVPDMVVGSLGKASNGVDTGTIHLLLMNIDGTVKRTVEINAQMPNGPRVDPGDLFGISVAGVGDLDGDGVPDMAVGAPRYATHGGSDSVHLLMMNYDGTVKRTIEIDGQTPNGPRIGPESRFGKSVSGLGDLDGDGSVEIAIGAPGLYTLPPWRAGGIFIVSVDVDGVVQHTTVVDASTENGPSLRDGVDPSLMHDDGRLGNSVAGIGDLDGDGSAEIISGAGDLQPYALYVMYTRSDTARVTETKFENSSSGAAYDARDMDTRDESDFVTTWKTGSPNESVRIPVGGATGTYVVDWGDGSASMHSDDDAIHEYASPGTYQIRISGNFARIYLGGSDAANAAKLHSIDQWGDVRWTSMASAFAGASNMKYNAPDAPDLSNVTDMSEMFFRASAFNGDLSSWDTSGVTDMSGMFTYAVSFNQPLDSWDTSNVTDMSYMFVRANSFNQPLDSWDTSGVTDMSGMFTHAVSFNQPLDSWDTSNVTDMSYMFILAHSFNQPLDSWDTSGVTDMISMFTHAHSFNQPLDSWNVSNVKDMTFMFTVARAFNQPLNSWDTSGVTSMFRMFTSAISFNQPLNSWDTSNVTDMSGMFSNAVSFNGDISSWDTSGVTKMPRMFSEARSFNGDISSWDTSNVTDMSGMFSFATSFNQPVGLWDISKASKIKQMFVSNTNFDQNLGDWYVVPDNLAVDAGQADVARIKAQNGFLDAQSPTYRVAPGDDGDAFEMIGDILRSTESRYSKPAYHLTIISEGGFGSTNSKDVLVTVTGTAGAGSLPLKSTVSVGSLVVPGSMGELYGGIGASISGIGDLDGDGVPDMVAGVPGGFAGNMQASKVLVLYLNPNGTVKRGMVINDSTPNGPSGLNPRNDFGASISGIGDLDGDGVPDVAVGAPGCTDRDASVGSVYLMLMNPDGTVKRTMLIGSQTPGGPLPSLGDCFGASISGIGDLDGDGVPDIAAGAPANSTRSGASGSVYLMLMNPDGTIKRTIEINGMTPNGPSTDTNEIFGASISGIGDLDGDGVPDIAAGAPANSTRSGASGSVYLMLMNPDGTIKRTIEINGMTPNGPRIGIADVFGASLANLGDLDGNNAIEIVVGAPGYVDRPARGTGNIYVMSVTPDGQVERTIKVDSHTPNGPILASGGNFGASLANLGDLDGNGSPDIAVGSARPSILHILYTEP